MVENSGGIISRGYGKFSRIITRGFGRFFKTQVFKKKKKLPFYREFNFKIYIPIKKEITLEKEIRVNILKKIVSNYLIKFKIKKEINYKNNLYIPVRHNFEVVYDINQKVNNRKLINTLNILLEDD